MLFHRRKIISSASLMLAVLLAITSCSTKPSEKAIYEENYEEKVLESEFSYSEAFDDNGYFNGIRALDYIKLFDYQSLSIPYDKHYVSDESVQAEIDAIIEYFEITGQILDRAVEAGDLVNIDYVGSMDGIKFTGGSTDGVGTTVTAGGSGYIDDFLDQLIGHTPGETFNIEATFPKDYEDESLRGKTALFVTTINYIKGEAVLTDAHIVEFLSETYGWTTVKEATDAIRSDLHDYAIEQYINNYVVEYVDTSVDIQSIPKELLNYYERYTINYFEEEAEYYGLSLNDFLEQYVGTSDINTLLEQYRDDNLKEAAFYLVLQAIAEDAELTVNELALDTYFLESMGLDDYSEYEEYFGLAYLKRTVLNQKVFDLIIGNVILEQQ